MHGAGVEFCHEISCFLQCKSEPFITIFVVWGWAFAWKAKYSILPQAIYRKYPKLARVLSPNPHCAHLAHTFFEGGAHPRSVNWHQTRLRRIKHWLIQRLVTASHFKGWDWIQVDSIASVEAECLEDQTKGLKNADFWTFTHLQGSVINKAMV